MNGAVPAKRITFLLLMAAVSTCASTQPLRSPTSDPEPLDAVVREPTIEVVLDGLPVSAAQKITQQTPLAYHDSALYTINIEPGAAGDGRGKDLLTVIRRGTLDKTGRWAWQRTVLDEHTPYDPWHTPPAVGVDEIGRVHVAYAMHNSPWRYATSVRLGNIENFQYRGQSVSRTALDRAVRENQANFPTLGTAAIPGNQVTYPAFYNDRNGELWVTYRFAAKPARRFVERTMSAGVARYDARSGLWKAIGGPVAVDPGRDFKPDPNGWDRLPVALAASTGWTVYHPRLAFAEDNTLHASWFWREGGAGATVTRPCHIVRHAGGRYEELLVSGARVEPANVPIPVTHCGNVVRDKRREFLTIGNLAVNSRGEPHMVLSPVGDSRVLYHWTDGKWQVESLPYSATEIVIDREDNLWAIASGPNIFVRRDGEQEWLPVHESDDQRFCSARAVMDRTGSTDRAYVYVDHCGEPLVSVLAVDLVVPSAAP